MERELPCILLRLASSWQGSSVGGDYFKE